VIVPPTGIRVLVATKPVDFRNYAERAIMQSERSVDSRLFLLSTT
jgi:hypothetical protein